MTSEAAREARARVDAVLDSPAGRLKLMDSLYVAPAGQRSAHLPYRRAALAFMDWQLRRGLLNPVAGDAPAGSPWWRAVNERLLLDTAEGRAALWHRGARPSTASARFAAEFAERPTARSWYRAHNASVVAAYLDHRGLAEEEDRVERFFMNLVLVRVLYAHALVAAPGRALAWAAPVAPLLGDPRVGMTGLFLSLSRVLPDAYPLGHDLELYVEAEHGFGRLLDIGVIRPRVRDLFEWSARELQVPELRGLLEGDLPAYAWDASDDAAWNQAPGVVARLARKLLPPTTVGS